MKNDFRHFQRVCKGDLFISKNAHFKDQITQIQLYEIKKCLHFISKGSCRSRAWQCKKIWRSAVLTGNQECYKKLNTYGQKFGNCGQLASGNYLACRGENTLCGLLHCTGMPGSVFPKVGYRPWRMTLHVSVAGKRHQCVVAGAGRNPGEREDPCKKLHCLGFIEDRDRAFWRFLIAQYCMNAFSILIKFYSTLSSMNRCQL